MPLFYNAIKAVAEVGCSKRTLSRICKELGIKEFHGKFLISAEELERIKVAWKIREEKRKEGTRKGKASVNWSRAY